MARLTLSFKGRYLSIHHLDEQPATIGRDDDCRICIDSLAVAPRQAALEPVNDGYLLLCLDPDYPVQVNNEQVDQVSLHHGDLIQIGKHSLIFSDDSLELAPTSPIANAEIDVKSGDEYKYEAQANEPVEQLDEGATDSVTGYMQIQSGPRIGRVVVFRRPVTPLKRAGVDGVVVTREDNSYKLVRLNEQVPIKIEGIPVEEEDVEVALSDNSLVEIDNVRFQFFTDIADGTQGATDKDC